MPRRNSRRRKSVSAAANLPQAIYGYFNAASQDHVAAQLDRGLLVLDDVAKAGVKRNPKQPFAWPTKAANAAGEPDGQA